MTAYLLPAALGLAAFALMLGALSFRCALGRHAWRVCGPAVRCERCGRRTNLYPLLMRTKR
jgi:hypothetical protein